MRELQTAMFAIKGATVGAGADKFMREAWTYMTYDLTSRGIS